MSAREISARQISAQQANRTSTPHASAGYRWERGSDLLAWEMLPEEWAALLPAPLPGSGRELAAMVCADHRSARAAALARAAASGLPVFVRFRLETAGGALWVRERLAAVAGTDAIEGEFVALSAGEAELAEFDSAGSYDLLTGTFSRQRLYQGLQKSVAKACSAGGSGGYLVVDIDNFGLLNQAYGCRTGDLVLVALAERLYRLLGAGALLGRVGEDSFGIVIEGVDEDSTLALAERLVRGVAETPIPDMDGLTVTASAGAVVFPMAASTAEEAMARADLAVAGAKTAGRNACELYALSASQQAMQQRGLAVVRKVQEALAENRLVFAYQPVVSARSHRPTVNLKKVVSTKQKVSMNTRGTFPGK